MLFLGTAVWKKTIGIIGMGRIGTAVARRASGFQMQIRYYSRRRLSKRLENALAAEYTSLDELLQTSDYISLNVPLTAETHHLLDEKRLRLMKSTAILVNTSRGSVIDQRALYTALKEKWIAGAGLDVFAEEPIRSTSPLLTLDNIVLTPHIASATVESRSMMAKIAAENLLSLLRGVDPLHLVNPRVKKIRSLEEIKLI
jgi:glyoxylate reductase